MANFPKYNERSNDLMGRVTGYLNKSRLTFSSLSLLLSVYISLIYLHLRPPPKNLQQKIPEKKKDNYI